MPKDIIKSLSMDFAMDITNTPAVMFGDFVLKSGIKSNYFINFGNLCNGRDIKMIGEYFAFYIFTGINKKFPAPDVIFGPAYKGINIAISTSIALVSKYNINIPFAYNRKVEKGHGEHGRFVGYDLNKAKTALIVDDVITNGGTKYEVINMLSQFKNLSVVGMVVGVDRQETNEEGKDYISIFKDKTGVDIYSLTNKENIFKFNKT